jgi:hypothetical protein
MRKTKIKYPWTSLTSLSLTFTRFLVDYIGIFLHVAILWPHIILDTCTQYTFNIICKKNTTPIRSTRTEEAHHQTLPKASPNSETPPSKRQGKTYFGLLLSKISSETFLAKFTKNHTRTIKRLGFFLVPTQKSHLKRSEMKTNCRIVSD